MKNNTKTKKVVVNLTSVESTDDIKLEFILANVRAGVPITEDDVKFLVKLGAEVAMDIYKSSFVNIGEDEAKNLLKDMIKMIDKNKKPWYKRFWGWITKPFKKNK